MKDMTKERDRERVILVIKLDLELPKGTVIPSDKSLQNVTV